MCRMTTVMTSVLIMALSVAAVQSFGALPQASAAVQGYSIPGLPGFGVEEGLDSTGKIGELRVYQGPKPVQVLSVCTGEPVPRVGDAGALATADYNFDGYPDLALEVASRAGNASFCIWLFDPKAQRFVPSKELSQLTDPRPDPNTRTVVSYKKENCVGACYEQETYAWSNGQLKLVKYESQEEDPSLPAGPGDCKYVLTVKEEKGGRMVEVSRKRVNNVGAMCGPLR